MRTTIDNLAEQAFITPHEYALASSVMDQSAAELLMGYELEISPEAASVVPQLKPIVHEPAARQYRSDQVFECATDLRNLGFRALVNEDDLSDGLYEIQSQPSHGAIPLAVATRGLARAGFIPKQAESLQVTAHVSLAAPEAVSYNGQQGVQLIRMLRVVEMLGGASSERLVEGLVHPANEMQSWQRRGAAGVSIGCVDHTEWQGRQRENRVELRSLEYRDPLQFADTLERIYFMGRAILSNDPDEQARYKEYDDWLTDYFVGHDLPNIDEQTLNSYLRSMRKLDNLFGYLKAYGAHVATHGTEEVEAATTGLVDELRWSSHPALPAVVDIGRFTYKKSRFSLRTESLPAQARVPFKPATAEA